ncbi:uncharacterized protein G2W53_014246 [Senna tora]|uniref:Uncharacterized protein n=1 Tax=Senna tora TaxID=362788 RepID=A0A834WT68_9FABA|nr:uncharacterized protein G2W53_014246 [Senna tora]
MMNLNGDEPQLAAIVAMKVERVKR